MVGAYKRRTSVCIYKHWFVYAKYKPNMVNTFCLNMSNISQIHVFFSNSYHHPLS